MNLDLWRRAGTEIGAVARATTATHRHLRDRLAMLAMATIGVDVLCAVPAWLLERHAH